MVKKKLAIYITFHDDIMIDTDDYPSKTVEEIVEITKEGIREDPMAIVEGELKTIEIEVIE